MSLIHFDHHIQAELFAKLRSNPSLRFKDLKDPELESSQFMYHLRELIKRKLVEKRADGQYCLTADGVALAQQFSSETGNLRVSPLSYTLIFLRSKNGRWYILKRSKHPYIGMYACISGKIHMNETLEQAATRELHDFTGGAVNSPLQYIGYVSVLIQRGKQCTHITGPIWFADNVDEVPLPILRRGIPCWDDWQKLDYKQFIPGWKEIVEMIETGKPNFLDLSFTITE